MRALSFNSRDVLKGLSGACVRSEIEILPREVCTTSQGRSSESIAASLALLVLAH